uniref:RRM domain-containing protein n=1 Tax=Ciona savignyi TaxID=51511 RepID=H2Z3J2_CIOSA
MNDTLSHKTVFVNGIPPSCSNDQLKETFSVIGPIKEAFVVRPKSGNVNRKLFGFVTYQSNDDAKSAVNSTSNTLSIDGTNVKVIFAKKKKFSKNIKKKPKNTNNENIGFDIVPLENVNSSKLEKPVESSDFNNKFVVAIEGPRNLEDMNTVWKKKSLGDISANNLRQENKTFFVSFPNKQKALKVASRLNNIAFNDFPVTAALQMDPESKDFRKSSKKSRLIVRNLSFFCSEEELKNVFKKFGKITDTKIPVKPDGRKLGYAFIQFSHVLEAGKAIKAVNMSEIKGRKVAVDWALPREKYKEMTKTDKKKKRMT